MSKELKDQSPVESPQSQVEVEKDKSYLFQKGQSGNPMGRPKGSKNKTTLIKQAIEGDMIEALQEEAPAILRKAIEKALKGNDAMLKLLIERLLPIRKSVEEDEKSGVPNIIISVRGINDSSGVTIEGERSYVEGSEADSY